jgi:hypothetical protein
MTEVTPGGRGGPGGSGGPGGPGGNGVPSTLYLSLEEEEEEEERPAEEPFTASIGSASSSLEVPNLLLTRKGLMRSRRRTFCPLLLLNNPSCKLVEEEEG